MLCIQKCETPEVKYSKTDFTSRFSVTNTEEIKSEKRFSK